MSAVAEAPPATAARDADPPPPAEKVYRVRFGQSGDSDEYLAAGFYTDEENFAWSRDEFSSLEFRHPNVPGQYFVRVRGRGMPSLRSRERGDLVVELFIETPSKLTPRQRELMREFAGLCGDQQHPKSANFLGKAKTFWDKVTGD